MGGSGLSFAAETPAWDEAMARSPPKSPGDRVAPGTDRALVTELALVTHPALGRPFDLPHNPA